MEQSHLFAVDFQPTSWLLHKEKKKSLKLLSDFPGGPVVKNPFAKARDTLYLWSGKTPHALGQLSPCPTTTEPTRPRAHAPQEKLPQWEAHTPGLDSSLQLPQLEKIFLQQERPSEAQK